MAVTTAGLTLFVSARVKFLSQRGMVVDLRLQSPYSLPTLCVDLNIWKAHCPSSAC